jgi:hypothetical protein
MPWFRHPYLVRGVVHTPLGAFRLDRGVADLPHGVGEALGWQAIDPSEDVADGGIRDGLFSVIAPRSDVDGFPEQNVTDADGDAATRSLNALLAAVTTAVRGRNRIAVPDHGIFVAFEDGIVATCATCGVSWEVSRRHFKHLAWWRCPGGCRS